MTADIIVAIIAALTGWIARGTYDRYRQHAYQRRIDRILNEAKAKQVQY